jgi:hypothetical protein
MGLHLGGNILHNARSMVFNNYFADDYGVTCPGDITWRHAVNSLEVLAHSLNGPAMFIESDIRFPKYRRIPVALQPPRTESDLECKSLINRIKTSNKGLKLDFKDPATVPVCLEMLQAANLCQPVLLNADVLTGNGAQASEFDAQAFIALCRNAYPKGILSLGWTTTPNREFPYTRENIDVMLSLSEGIAEITFPVRACHLPQSWDELRRLIEIDGRTLTIWNNEPINADLAAWIKEHTDPAKTFYDLIDAHKGPLTI